MGWKDDFAEFIIILFLSVLDNTDVSDLSTSEQYTSRDRAAVVC